MLNRRMIQKKKAANQKATRKEKVYLHSYKIAQKVAGTILENGESSITIEVRMISNDTESQKHEDFLQAVRQFLRRYPTSIPAPEKSF